MLIIIDMKYSGTSILRISQLVKVSVPLKILCFILTQDYSSPKNIQNSL